MNYVERFRVPPGTSVKLKDIDPGFKDHQHESHKEAAEELEGYRQRLRELQELLHANGRQSLLICLQALDAGGKDGTIPADHHWFRNLAVGRIVVEHLEGLQMTFPPPTVDIKHIRQEYHSAKKRGD